MACRRGRGRYPFLFLALTLDHTISQSVVRCQLCFSNEVFFGRSKYTPASANLSDIPMNDVLWRKDFAGIDSVLGWVL